jgi:hypothetical protein
MRKIGLAVAVIVVLVGVVGYGLVTYGPPEVRTAVNKVVQLVVPQADIRKTLDEAIGQLPPGYTASYKTAEYDVVSDTLTVSGVAVHTADGVDLSAEQIEVIKPSKDFAAGWSQARANPTQIPQDKALPIAGVIAVKGVKGRAAAFEGGVQSARIEGLRLYPWAFLHEGVPSWGEAMTKAATPGAPDDLDKIVPLLRLEAALLLGLGYDRYAADGMNVSGKSVATPEMPATDIAYEFRKMTAENVDRGIAGGYSAEGLQVRIGPVVDLSIERVALADLNLRKSLIQVLESPKPAPEMLDGLAIGKIEYAGMTLRPKQGGPIPMGTLTVSKILFTGSVPVSGDLAYEGLKLNRAQLPDPKAQEAFDKLGLETITESFGFSFRWELDKKRMTVTDLRNKVDELGTTTASVELTEMTPGIVNMMQGQLAHAKLRYDDNSAVERAFKAMAAENGTDAEMLRKQIIDMIQVQGQALGDSPAIAEAVKALVAFLQAPKSLTIELAPSAPVPLAALGNASNMPPTQLVQVLGLSVSANQ